MDAAFDEYFMRMALREAEMAAAAGEVPTGCVVVEVPADESAPPAAARILARACVYCDKGVLLPSEGDALRRRESHRGA